MRYELSFSHFLAVLTVGGIGLALTGTCAAVEKATLAEPALEEGALWKAGVAKVRITPDKSLWMAGFSARTKPSEGTLQELYAKALALEDQSGTRVVLVTTDLIGSPAVVAKKIADAVVDYSHRLKHELGPTTSVASYANDVMEYIPSLRVLKEGGYEATIFSAHVAGAAWAPPVEELIVGKAHELVAEVRGAAKTPPAGYQLAWEDEFDGTTPDTTKWSYRFLGRRHDALNVTNAVSVGGGRLTITTYTSGGKHYTGMIGTEAKFERRFGYWEARLRFEGAPGSWSAFWIQTPTFGRPAGDPATAGMEIDVVEHRVSDKSSKDISGKAHHAVHYGGSGKDVKSQSHVTEDLNLGSGFHTFGVEWTETEYRFFVDGKLTWTATPVSKRPQYIILSSEVRDKGWAGTIPTDGYGPLERSKTKMVVDYVRFYECRPGPERKQ